MRLEWKIFWLLFIKMSCIVIMFSKSVQET